MQLLAACLLAASGGLARQRLSDGSAPLSPLSRFQRTPPSAPRTSPLRAPSPRSRRRPSLALFTGSQLAFAFSLSLSHSRISFSLCLSFSRHLSPHSDVLHHASEAHSLSLARSHPRGIFAAFLSPATRYTRSFLLTPARFVSPSFRLSRVLPSRSRVRQITPLFPFPVLPLPTRLSHLPLSHCSTISLS